MFVLSVLHRAAGQCIITRFSTNMGVAIKKISHLRLVIKMHSAKKKWNIMYHTKFQSSLFNISSRSGFCVLSVSIKSMHQLDSPGTKGEAQHAAQVKLIDTAMKHTFLRSH